MNTFSELVRTRVSDMSIECLRDMTGWDHTKCHQMKQGHMRAAQISFSDAVHLSKCIGLDIADMADSTGQ